MIRNLIFWLSRNVFPDGFSYCRKCEDVISFYAFIYDLMCGSCRAQWMERRKGCKTGDECVTCHQARVGIELTFRKDYGEQCFGCYFKPAYYARLIEGLQLRLTHGTLR